MSILLTGSSGLIGNYLKTYLSNTYDIIELDFNNELSIDATNEDSVKSFFDSLENKKIKYIINCIGIPDFPLIAESILDIDIDYFKKMIDINLNAVFIIIKECYRKFQTGLEYIINISSLYSVVSPRTDIYSGKIKNPAYTASKHGLIGLSKHLAVLLAKDNIKVNCIAPAGIINSIENDSTFLTNYNNQVPLGRPVNLDDIYKAVIYLFDNNNITGQNIIIDGGYTLI